MCSCYSNQRWQEIFVTVRVIRAWVVLASQVQVVLLMLGQVALLTLELEGLAIKVSEVLNIQALVGLDTTGLAVQDIEA